MTGISRTVTVGGKPFNTEHRLNEFKYIELIKQKKRSLALERNKAMRKKVEVLTKANILREVKYQTWVSNPVMVKKDDRRWKLCVDFTDINKACPKDHHPLPAIDQKIEILSKFRLKVIHRRIQSPESISLKGSRQDTSFLENIKELHKWEDSLMDDIIRRSFSKHERIHRDITNGYSSNRRRHIGNVPRSLKRKHKRIVVSRVRKKASTYVLHEPNAVRSRIGLPRAGKTHTSPHTRCKKTPKTEVEETESKEPGPKNAWKLFTDGASSSNGSKAGLMLVRPEGKKYTYAFRFESETTINKAEYEALLASLRIGAEMKIQELAIFVDSQLVANQVKGLFEARQPIIKQYMEKTKKILKSFSSYSIEHIRRDQNNKADALNKLASMTFSKLAKEVLVEVGQYKQRTLSKRYIKAHVECMQGHS
ncbi:reverse transcriptase domain-containing protein [Tanacetum coccineum]